MYNNSIPLIDASPDVHIQSMMTAGLSSDVPASVEADPQQQHQPTASQTKGQYLVI